MLIGYLAGTSRQSKHVATFLLMKSVLWALLFHCFYVLVNFMFTWGSVQLMPENFYTMEFINFMLIFKPINIKYIMMFCPLIFPYALLNRQVSKNMLESYLKRILWLEWVAKIGNWIFSFNLVSVKPTKLKKKNHSSD